jgi:hypothetical protein
MDEWKKRKKQYSSTPALQYSLAKYLLCFLCVGLWLLTGNSVVLGARVSGEKGVTPITPEAKQKIPGPVKVKPLPKERPSNPKKKPFKRR